MGVKKPGRGVPMDSMNVSVDLRQKAEQAAEDLAKSGADNVEVPDYQGCFVGRSIPKEAIPLGDITVGDSIFKLYQAA